MRPRRRGKCAHFRQLLVADATNAASLHTVDSALFVICLDDDVSPVEVAPEGTPQVADLMACPRSDDVSPFRVNTCVEVAPRGHAQPVALLGD